MQHQINKLSFSLIHIAILGILTTYAQKNTRELITKVNLLI